LPSPCPSEHRASRAGGFFVPLSLGGVAHEALQRLGVDPGSDHQGGEGMGALVQRNALKPGIPPKRRGNFSKRR
jgi:hypothetical protein